MDLDFSLLTFSPSCVKNSKSSTKCPKLMKNRRVNSSTNNGQITSEKKWTSSNLNSTKEIAKSDLTSKYNVERFVSIGDKSFNKSRVNKGKENRFNKYKNHASDGQDPLLLKTVSKVRPWLSTEFSPDTISAKKKRLMEKVSLKQTPSFLERLKTNENNLTRNKTASSYPAVLPELAADGRHKMYSDRTNNKNGNNLVSDSVIVISDSGSDSSDIITASPKTQMKSPWSGNLKKKNVLHKDTVIILESSDSDSEIDKIPLNLCTPVTHAQKNTSHETKQNHLPVNSTPLLPSEALSSQLKHKDIQSWISNIPSLTDLDVTSDTQYISNTGVQENISDNVGFTTSTEELLKNLYGPSLQLSLLNCKTPCTESKLIQQNVGYTECVKINIQEKSLNSTKSEDFENFLKNVRHNFEGQNYESAKDSVSFINDEDDDENNSITFYHTAFNGIRNSDLKKDKSPSNSSSGSNKKSFININRKLVFSSSSSDVDDDQLDRKKNSSEDSESKAITRRKENYDLPDSKKSSCDDGESKLKTRRKKKIVLQSSKESSSGDSESKLKTRRKKIIDSPNSSSNDETRVKVKRKNGIKRTPKVISSPVKRLIKTAPKSWNRKKTIRTSLQSNLCSSQLSFLASLSSNSSSNSHPEGVYYKNNFKRKKEELCKKLFSLYNSQVFNNKLPESLLIEWNVRMKKTAGFCYNRQTLQAPGIRVRTSRIVLSTKVCDTAERLRDTLIHELCHAATWIIDNVKDGHGPQWKSWARRAMNTFLELPPIKRCHDYKIQTKFTYRCTSCGYSIGRHSKSLDIATKRCGLCFGVFELLVNSRRNSGTIVQQSVKKRSPVGFARFVKENYNTVKTSQTNMKHAEVMRLLGQQFSAVKIGAKKLD